MTTTITSRRTRAFIALAFGATAVVSLLTPVLAQAAPIDEKRKQADALEADIDANGLQLDGLNEAIKGAQDKVANAAAQITDAQAHIDQAKTEMQRIEQLVRQRAASIYRSSANGGDGVDIFDLDIRTLTSREQYSSAASDRDNSLLDDLDAARDDLKSRRQDAQSAKDVADQEKAALDASKAAFEKAQAERRALLDQVTGELESLVAEAAAARAAAAPKPKDTSNDGQAFDPTKVPPASGKAGIAVAYAQAQIGKAYCTGGKGPDCYDCSGLTSQAWGAAGVSMPSQSESQLASFPQVPMDQLEPGDIVWHPGHVGLYVGGGSVIHASSEAHNPNAVMYDSRGVGGYQKAVRPG